jgi:hypothetical protein
VTIKSGIRIACAVLLLPLAAHAKGADPLLEGFRKPPQSAKPRVWWHWMNGNVTPEGIRRDLDWMNRVGIGGVDAIDASIDTPQVVKKRLIYMTPEWKRAFRQATALADQHGMEVSVDSSPGWSETGGPWVAPQAAMKKLVWSSTALDGPFHGVLPLPPSVPGPFQNIPNTATNAPSFYRDAVVVAYRAPAEPRPVEAVSNGGAVDAPALQDGDLTNGAALKPLSPGQDVWVRIDYGRPARIQGVTLALTTPDGLGFAARVEASDDGRDWRGVTDIPKAAQVRRFALLQQTIAFAPVTARYFRLMIRPDAPIPNSLRIVERAPGLADAPAPPPPGEDARLYRLRELVFHAGATVNEFEKKAGFAIARDNYAIATPGDAVPGTVIKRGDVVLLSDHMAADGTLDWTPPPGHWTVLRMGYSLTGSQNHPATKEATGLEVDKLSRSHVRDYMERYLDTYVDAAGPGLFGRRGLTSLTVDSTEVGAQNWTETMLADFRRLRGYDPTPWLPTLTGMVVGSAADSDKFLWDWRRTIADLTAQNHYGEIARIAAERGLLDYAEALEDHRPTFGDDIDMRRFARVPMGAMWAYDAAPRATYIADLLGAASVAHVYGRELVAAESLTSAGQPWAYAPRMLKPMVDMEFALGVNRIFLHTSVHQPVDRAPGLSLGGYGQFFNRLDAWAGMAGGWMNYIARCSWLLRQGRHAADIAYFYGQEAPVTGLFGDAAVDVPPGHGFDFVGSDAVLHLLSVNHGELMTPSGMRYRLLYLGGSSRFMSLPVLRRVRDLAMQGAVVVGRKPLSSPSLADDPAQFQALADEVFGSGDAEHALGQGRVFAAGSLPAALAALKLAPDFAYTKPQADTELLSLHRHLADGELYFVTNRRDRPQDVAATFRVTGREAEIWDAVTGRRVRAVVTDKEGRSTTALSLPAYGSAFVIFRKHGSAITSATASIPLQTLQGPWTVTFQPGRGAPAHAVQTALDSWSNNADPGIRYFSGTATYRKAFDLPKTTGRLVLDLGTAREVAEVTLNGKSLGTAWTAPFALDITRAARPGRNRLTVRVSNLWVNRLIGDAQPGGGKYTFTTIPTYRADAPLRESGLIGPVTIRQDR